MLLEDQDRALWDRQQIDARHARWSSARSASAGGARTCCRRQIAAEHAAAETDWRRIASLYDVLMAAGPTPVVALNRAVAVAMADGPERGLELIDEVARATRRLPPAARRARGPAAPPRPQRGSGSLHTACARARHEPGGACVPGGARGGCHKVVTKSDFSLSLAAPLPPLRFRGSGRGSGRSPGHSPPTRWLSRQWAGASAGFPSACARGWIDCRWCEPGPEEAAAKVIDASRPRQSQ